MTLEQIDTRLELCRLTITTESAILREKLAEVEAKVHHGVAFSPRRHAQLNHQIFVVQEALARLWGLHSVRKDMENDTDRNNANPDTLD